MADMADLEKAPLDDDGEIFHVEPRPGARIRFGDQEDEEAGRRTTDRLPKMGKSATSASNMSIQSMHSMTRRNSMDPALALPITYRTV